MKCRTCKEIMKDVPIGFDAFSFINPTKMMYCNNDKCTRFGDVTVAGLLEDSTPPTKP